MSKLKALALPIFRKYWLWTALPVGPTAPAASAAAAAAEYGAKGAAATVTRRWQDGATLEEKFGILGQRIADRFQQKLGAEWHKLESARHGTLRNRGYRLAQAVLAREDPQETFLKSIPTEEAEMLVVYPGSLKEKLVRRRLRALALQGRRRHRARIFWWSLAMVPQLPLMLTPLPNLTVYYTVYRLYSHLRALQGSKSLEKGFAALDSEQLRALRDDLLRIQAAQGIEFPADSWPAKLVQQDARYLDIFDRLKLLQKQRRLEAIFRGEEAPPSAEVVLDASERHIGPGVPQDPTVDTAGVMAAWGERGEDELEKREEEKEIEPRCRNDSGGGKEEGVKVAGVSDERRKILSFFARSRRKEEGTGMHLSFYGSAELDDLVLPDERLRFPLSDESAMKIGSLFGVTYLIESVARVRRRVVGSMFPAHTEQWPSYSMRENADGKKDR